MKTLLIISLASLYSFISYGQDEKFPKGKIPDEHFTMQQYDKDPDAEAVVLHDEGISSFLRGESGFSIIFERFTRIKIFSDAGLEYGEIDILLYQEKGGIWEKAYDIEAYVYNVEDGIKKATKLDVSQVYDEKINDYWMRKKIAFPNVKPGSIIEYSYKIKSPYLFNLRDWEFQNKIPTAFSKYTTNMIPFYEYVYILQGASKFNNQKSYKENGVQRQFGPMMYNDYVHEFTMKDIPAFVGESFISSPDDYIVKMDFQLAKIHQLNGSVREVITTWDLMVKNLNKHSEFGKFIDKAEKFSIKNIDQKELIGKSEQELIKWAVDYTKNNFHWDGYYSKYSNKTFREFEKDKTGSAGGINLFLCGLLRSLGIDVDPVIISTRGHGKIFENYPFASFFNYTIISAKLGEGRMMLDGTDMLLPYYMLPERCYNDKGLIVFNDRHGWINYNSIAKLGDIYNIYIKFKSDLSQDVVMTHTGESYRSYSLRKRLESGKDAVVKHLAQKEYKLSSDNVIIKNANRPEHPFSYSASIDYPSEIIEDKLYVNPFLNESWSEHPLPEKNRTYPVDFIHKRSEKFNTIIEIPEGYVVEYIPRNKTYSNNDIDLKLEIVELSGKLNVMFNYEFKKSEYPVKNYAQLQFYFKDILKITNEKIVLVKSAG